MLSSSPPKIHEPLVTGVSPRPTDRRAAPGNCETRVALWGSRTWHTLLTSGDRRSGMIATVSLRLSYLISSRF